MIYSLVGPEVEHPLITVHSASMERRQGNASPLTVRHSTQKKTCAEIVNEARQSLRVLSTQRPFTPRDAHRQLFGDAQRDSRPPSTFSLHARNFDSSDSRPGSGSRLSPLTHKPHFPASCDVAEPVKACPKPPAVPLEEKRTLAGTRARLLRAGSLTALAPVQRVAEARERLSPDEEQRQQSAKREDRGPPSADHTVVHGTGPRKPGPRRTASESVIRRPDADSSVKPTECGAATRTELGNGGNTACQKEDVESLVWNNHMAPFIQELESMAAGGPEASVDSLCETCDGLHAALATHGMLGRRCKRRAAILRTLFRLIDLNSARLNLHIAKLCLALCVSGNNLLNICKLIFKISRSESNDVLFHNNSIIDSLLVVLSTEDACASSEALLYCVGTLKFLSGNSALLRLLLDKNCMGVAHGLILSLHPLSTPGHTHFTVAGHILVQLTATLRNLADHQESRPLFVSHGVLSELCVALRHHRGDQDVCTNIARICSKLSSYSECRLALLQTPDCCQLFIELLSKYTRKQDLVVRLLFTLGNLTAKSDEAREQLFQSQGCMDTLLQLYGAYQQRDDGCSDADAPPGPPGDASASSARLRSGQRESEDVLVKLVRVLANMCVHPAVGPALAADAACVQLLLETLELRSVPESEELLVNVAVTINNLSFYQGASSVIRHKQIPIAKMLLKLLLSSSMDTVLEATRVYGNLSQSKDVRDFIMQNKVYQFVVTLMDSKNCDVCFSACGILTNLALDPPNRVTLSLEGSAGKLADCLRDFGPGDWQLAGQVCQALWNLTEQSGSQRDSLTLLNTRERESLLETLSAYLDDDEALCWTASDDMGEFHRSCWESEFVPVAQKLQNRLRSMH